MTDSKSLNSMNATTNEDWLNLDISDSEWGWPLTELSPNHSLIEPSRTGSHMHHDTTEQHVSGFEQPTAHDNSVSEYDERDWDDSVENVSYTDSSSMSGDSHISFYFSDHGRERLQRISPTENRGSSPYPQSPNSLPDLASSPRGYFSDDNLRAPSPAFSDSTNDSLPEVIFALDGAEDRLNEVAHQAAFDITDKINEINVSFNEFERCHEKMRAIDERIRECGDKFRRSVLKNKTHSYHVQQHKIAVLTREKLSLLVEASSRADELAQQRQEVASLKEVIRSARTEVSDIW